jgi:putative ABC transport system ATP-binding protein
MQAREVLLQADGLVHTFADGGRNRKVLDGVSLTLRRSEVVLLMGPTGSGKSTLLAVLSGLLRPSAGSVRLRGEDLWRISERRREEIRQLYFGFVFQGFNLFSALTAGQQLEIVLRWSSGVSSREARQRAEHMLKLLHLGDKIPQLPAQMSGGEKQRVAIGRALVKGPALCFADEPTSALDWEHGEEVVAMLRAIARDREAAVLMVSHDDRLSAYADRVLDLRQGRLVERTTRCPRTPSLGGEPAIDFVL